MSTRYIQFDRPGYDALMDRVQKALAPLTDELGVKFIATTGRFTTFSGHMKIETKIVDDSSPESLNKHRKREWSTYCRNYGLEPDDYGKSIWIGGTLYEVAGIKLGNRKNVILLRNPVNGKTYVAPASDVRASLARMKQAETPKMSKHRPSFKVEINYDDGKDRKTDGWD